MQRKLSLMMCLFTMIVSSAAAFAAAPSPHTMAVIDGTMHKTEDGKGYVIKVETATDKEGKELPDMKGMAMPMPGDMSNPNISP
jgi:hypothetical protein